MSEVIKDVSAETQDMYTVRDPASLGKCPQLRLARANPDDMQTYVLWHAFGGNGFNGQMWALYDLEPTDHHNVEPAIAHLGGAGKLAPIHVGHTIWDDYGGQTRMCLSVMRPQVVGYVAYRRVSNARGYAVREVIEPIAQRTNQATCHRLRQPMLSFHQREAMPKTSYGAKDHCLIAVGMDNADVTLIEYLSKMLGGSQQGSVIIGQDDWFNALPTCLGSQFTVVEKNEQYTHPLRHESAHNPEHMAFDPSKELANCAYRNTPQIC
jgi:hypothetical protein